MTTIDLSSLGISSDDLAERVVDRIANTVLKQYYTDEDGDEDSSGPSAFARSLEKRVLAKVDASIMDIAARHVLPHVGQYLETLCLQKTNDWGEKRGETITFIEYLVQRADAYLNEKVNYEGKPKGTDGYSWTGTQTRITYLVHQHLHYSIETAMKSAVKSVNDAILPALAETAKLKLSEIAKNLKISVEPK